MRPADERPGFDCRRRHLARTAWPIAVVFALLAAAGSGSIAQTPNSEDVQAELEALKQNIVSISQRLEAERAKRKSEQAALARTEQALARIALDLRTTRADLVRARDRQRELEAQAEALEAAVEARRRALAEQLQIAYRVGRQSRLKALLNQEDPAEISRVLALHGYLGRARLDAIAALNEELARLQAVREEQQQVAARLQSLAERQAAAKAGQDEALARRQAALDELASALADIPPETAIEPFSALRGRLPMPVDATVRAAFSDARSGNVNWQGWLIEAAVGTPVEAVAYGRVAYADWLRGYGMMLIVDHGDGFMTLYGQNQSLIAEVGDWVAPGDIVALAGNTGGNSAPGLYFQFRRDGQPVDPAGWVKR